MKRKNFANTSSVVRQIDDVEDSRTNASRLMVWLLCASLIAISAATSYMGYVYFNESPRFRLTHVEITGNDRATHEEIMRYLALQPDDNVFSIDLDMVRESLSRHPWIAEVEIRRVVPDTLMVAINEHVPVAIVAMSKLYYLNEAGEPFSLVQLADAPELPMLTGLDATFYEQNREQWNKLVKLGIAFYESAKRANLSIADVELDPSAGVVAHLSPAGTTAHMGTGDFDAKIRRLRDVRALLVERGQSADAFLLDNPRHPDAVVARLNVDCLPFGQCRTTDHKAFVGVR